MRTVCGFGRQAQILLGRGGPQPILTSQVRPLAGGRQPLITDQLGEQRRGGAQLDQVDGTTCGSAVLVALAAWADPAETQRLDDDPVGGTGALGGATAGVKAGFGSRYDARQKQVHQESTRFWPQAIGTSPWGMVAWLRRYAPGAGPYRVRLVDDMTETDVAAALAATRAVLAAGRPVPLLVGTLVPRHYCMALSVQDDGTWRVYEPSSGQTRSLDPALVGRRALAPVLGFDRLSAVLLPT